MKLLGIDLRVIHHKIEGKILNPLNFLFLFLFAANLQYECLESSCGFVVGWNIVCIFLVYILPIRASELK